MMRVFLTVAVVLGLSVCGDPARAATSLRMGGTVDVNDELHGELVAAAGAVRVGGRIDEGAVLAAGRIKIGRAHV